MNTVVVDTNAKHKCASCGKTFEVTKMFFFSHYLHCFKCSMQKLRRAKYV